MYLLTVIGILSCACAAFGGTREDLVYHRPKNPGWIASRTLDRDSRSIHGDQQLLKLETDSEQLDALTLYAKPFPQSHKKHRKPKKAHKGGYGMLNPDDAIDYWSQSQESNEWKPQPKWITDYGGDSWEQLPRKNNKNRHAKRRPVRPLDSASEEAYVVDLEKENEVIGGTSLDEPVNTGVAPHYMQALEDFNAASDVIQSHFKREAFTYEQTNDFRFVLIAVVVDGLSKIVAEKGWDDYDNNYKNIVKVLAEKAAVRPMESVEMIKCVFRKANNKINKIRSLMLNKWTQAICRTQPISCDAVILSQIKSYPDKKVEKQANLLLNLGESASTYLRYYAGVFEAVSKLNAFQYLANAKDLLRDLVTKNAAVRTVLFPKGGPTEEECGVDYY